MRIVRPRRRLGMVLHTEQRQVAVAQALESAVVQIDVRLDDLAVRQRIGVDGEVMVVRRDLYLLRLKLLHRMVPTVMSKLELVGFAAERETYELMSKTDSEDGFLPHQPPDVVLRVRARLGI